MPRRGAIALALTSIALVLLLNFKTPAQDGFTTTRLRAAGGGGGQAVNAAPVATVAPADQGGQGQGQPAGQLATQAPSTRAPAALKGKGQITGAAVDTPYGTVQVQVTLSNGRITDVQPLQLPGDRMRSQMISQYAAPVLRSEALQAQSAQIDLVSGATYTSDGYAQSLQAALDQAHG